MPPLGLDAGPVSSSCTSPQTSQRSQQRLRRDDRGVTPLYNFLQKLDVRGRSKGVVVPPAAPAPGEGSDADVSASGKLREMRDSFHRKVHRTACKGQEKVYNASIKCGRLCHGPNTDKIDGLGGVIGASSADPGHRIPRCLKQAVSKTTQVVSKTKHRVLNAIGHVRVVASVMFLVWSEEQKPYVRRGSLLVVVAVASCWQAVRATAWSCV